MVNPDQVQCRWVVFPDIMAYYKVICILKNGVTLNGVTLKQTNKLPFFW